MSDQRQDRERERERLEEEAQADLDVSEEASEQVRGGAEAGTSDKFSQLADTADSKDAQKMT